MKMNKNEPCGHNHLSSPLEIRGSLIARNTILNFFGLAVPLLVGIATIPFVIKKMGIDRFGVLSLAWVIIGYFGFFDLGLGRATTKFIAEALGKGEFEKVPKFFWTTVIFQGISGFAGTVILALITPLLTERILNIPSTLLGETKQTFYLLALSLPVVLVTASFRGALEAGQRFDLVNFVKIPSSVVNYIIPLAGVLIGFDLSGIMVLLIVGRVIALVAWIVICLRVFPVLKVKLSVHRETIKPLLSFGGWVTISNLIGPFLVYLDRFYIGTILTLEAVGYYSAPYELIMRVGIIPGSLLMTLFPIFSALKSGSNQERTKVLYGRSVKYLIMLIGMITVLLIIFANTIIKMWLGERFAQSSTYVFQILAIGFFINTLAGVPFSFLQGIGRADITAKFHVLEVFGYVPLAWILIKKWGINGAAAAWTVRVSLDMVLLFWASWKIGRIGVASLSENGVVRSAILLIVYALTGCFVMQFSWGIYGIMALTIGFLLSLWFYVFSELERVWILEKSRKLLRWRATI